MVQLLFASAPKIDGDLLLTELKKNCGAVERLGDKEDFYLYAFEEHIVEYQDNKKAPAQIFIAYPDKGKEKPEFDEQSLQQSWTWKEAINTVNTCTTTLLVTEMMAYGLDYKIRLNLFHNALKSVLSVVECNAIHWLTSQQYVNPKAYLDAKNSEKSNSLEYTLNVRFYNISNRPGEMLMDTLGLNVLRLPDIQCHFLDLDPNKVNQLIYNMAYYIFENGDIIQDGETIQGVKPEDKWKCMHEVALLEPKREVIDINPGTPFAAGNRK